MNQLPWKYSNSTDSTRFPQIVTGNESFSEMGGKVDYVVDLLCQLFNTSEGARQVVGALDKIISRHYPSYETDYFSMNAFVSTRQLVKHHLNLGNKPEPWMIEWLKLVADGHYLSKMMPLREGVGLVKHPDDVVYFIVTIVRSFGFKIYRNDASPEHSCLDIAARILINGRHSPVSYSGVKTAFQRARKSYRT
jgi:hypothetical protein